MYDNKAIYARANTNREEITVSVLYTIYLSTQAETKMNRWTLQSSCQADNCTKYLDHTPSYCMQQRALQPRKFFRELNKKKIPFPGSSTKAPHTILTANGVPTESKHLPFYSLPPLVRNRSRYGPGHLQLMPLLIFFPDKPSRQSAQTHQLASVLGSVGISPPRLKFDPTSKVGKLVVLKAGLRRSDALWANPLTGLYNQPFP